MAASKAIYCSSCFGAAMEAQEVKEIQGGTELHFMATQETQGFANPSKKQPEWQHQSSCSNGVEQKCRGMSMPWARA